MIAYIISAFKNAHQLLRLVNRLTEPDTHFAIHIDARSVPAFAEVISLLSKRTNVAFLPARRFRYRSFDHVQVSLEGLDHFSHSHVPFDHVVLLTGQDYPIKPISSIRAFLSQHKGESFLDNFPLPDDYWTHGGLNRFESWHLFVANKHIVFPKYDSHNWLKRKFPQGFTPYGGMGYWILARQAAEYVLHFASSHPGFVRFFRNVDIPDELFFHTILMNSPLRDSIISDDLRYIDWDKPQPPFPAVLTVADLEQLSRAPDLLARKFDTAVDAKILDLIDQHLLGALSTVGDTEHDEVKISEVYISLPEIAPIDGVAQQGVALATELKRRGVDTTVFVRRHCPSSNQYLQTLRRACVQTVCPPRLLAFLGRTSWATRDQLVRFAVRVASPLLVPPAAIDALVRRRSFVRSLRGARGYTGRVLGKVLLPDYLDHFFFRQLAHHLRQHRPDIVEVSRRDYVWQVDWFRRRGVPTIYKEHGSDSKWTPDQVQSLRNATCLIAVSEAAATALRQAVGTQADVFVVPNAVEVLARHDDCPAVESREASRGLTVLSVARLAEEKGVQFLPAVAKQTIAHVPSARFIVVGEGPLRPWLEQEKVRLGLGDRLCLLGAVSHAQVLEHLRDCDIFLLPSLTEGMPVAVIEAMACGTAIVATAVGGTPELISHEISGLLVPSSDAQALALAIVGLANDVELRERLGEAARQAYLDGPWNPTAMGDRTLEVYQFALQKHATTAIE